METTEKNWHVDTGAGVHETDAETLGQWIREGRVLQHHRISRSGMRWLEAGKVTQFAGYFPASVNMPPGTAAAGYRPGTGMHDAGYDVPSALKAAEPSFGLRLAAGSMLVLVIAAAAAYAWAYHVATPRDFAALLKEPEAQALQSRFETDKENVEAFRNVKPVSTPEYKPPTRSKLGPARTGDIASRKFPNISMAEYDDFGVGRALPRPGMPANFKPPTMNVDQQIADLTVKFEAEKKSLVENARAADSKSRFIPAFALLFVGLGGLNVVRMKPFSKK
jgi:hypothetical protein